MASSFTINQADLQFILRQIKIAEDTSEAYTPGTPAKTILQSIMDTYGLSAADAAIAPFGLRTVDGSFNSLIPGQSTFGAADTLFPRLTDPVFRNEGDDPAFFGVTNNDYGLVTAGPDNVVDADPRIISNLVVDMTAGNPAAVEAALNHSVFKGVIAEEDIAAAAAAIAAAYARTKSTNPADVADLSDDAASAVVAAIDVIGATLFGAPINQVDVNSALAAKTAAETAHAKAVLVVNALTAAGLAAGDPAWDAANAVATDAAALVTALTNYHGSLVLGEAVELGDEITAVGSAAELALVNEAAAQALTVQLEAMVFTGNDPVAAAQAHADLAAILDSYGVEYDSAEGSFVGGLVGSLVIPNLSPDIGLSPGFNSWMTFFGQFFDHGLDLVTKGGNGTVYVPLQADDPLIAGVDGAFGTADDLPAHLRFMALTRATPFQGGQENTTTSFVDQNQTYTSDPSHQVFLREYVRVGNETFATGKMLDGSAASGSVAGAIGNWAEVKAQALQMLGISLSDFDVHNAPMLRVDQYGKFIPVASGPNAGYAQMIISAGADGILNTADDVVKEGTLLGATVTSDVLRTGHGFLNDIAHHAAPGTFDLNHDQIPDGSQTADTDLLDYNRDGSVNAADVAAGILAGDLVDANNDTVIDMLDLADVNLDGVINAADLVADDRNATTYDNEMLDAHFVTGDGRGNENIALTTVHSIFHSEHNRAVEINKATILNSGNLAFINEWLRTDITNLADIDTQAEKDALIANAGAWDGERLFQAARFTTEMQYQHMVFEEFARRVQPMVDPFIFNTNPEVDPSILAEFAHTVYRFGHSMLTGTVDRLDNNLDLLNEDLDQATLLAVFLNPQAYIGSGATLEEINGNIIRGLSRDVGNAIDEFIVQDVRSNLLGLPLDLAMFNLSRGRETGIPSLNQTREQLYDDTGLADLKPYESWADFALNIKNAASVVNFIAAYGTHTSITSVGTLAEKRAAAEDLVFGGGAVSDADRLAFLNGPAATTGVDLIDLWIGGLAEKNPEFGGMLGTTFNYVFEFQMESLQFGDRMYYLSRTQGTGFLNNLEPNTFSDIVMRNTELGDVYSTHLNGALFTTPDYVIELDRGIAQEDYNGAETGNDPLGFDPILGAQVVRDYTGAAATYSGPGTHDEGGYLRVLGGNHYVLGGTEGADRIYGDSGIDTLWGDGGNDYLNGGTESDDVFGGLGDDIIEDPFGDDVLRGNQGNDVITAARGADLLFGDQDQDYIVLGQDASEVFGGEGTDFILGGEGKDFLLGNEGDDWIEGGGGFDTIAGENSELFFNSPIIGHDVAFGQGDEQDYDMESGDDIMGSGASVFRYEGMFGFDWAMGKGDFSTSGVNFDAAIPIFTTIPNDILKDRFDQVEGFSGWNYDDFLQGDDRGHKGGGSSAPDSVPVELFADHLLTQEGINRISGLQEWFGNYNGTTDLTDARYTLFGGTSGVPGSTPVSTFRDGNIIMGGDGNDTVRGRGGFDLIDGDAYLNVRIKIVIPTGPNAGTYSAESMNTDTTVAGEFAGKVYNTNPDGSPNFASVAFGGASLTSLLLNRTINPGQMSIVREILDGTVAYVNENFDTTISSGYTDDDATWTQNWTETNDGTNTSNGGDIQIVSFSGSNQLRFGNSTDGNEIITRSVDLSGRSSAFLSFTWQEVDRGNGEDVLVQALNLTNNTWETVGTMAGSAANGTGTFLVALTTNQIGAGSSIRFQAVGQWENNDSFYIDNVTIGDNPTDTDTALFQGTRAEYDIEGITNTTDAGDSTITYSGTARDLNGDGFISVRDRDTGLVGATVWRIVDGEATEVALSSRGLLTDDHDLYKNIEVFQFADQQLVVGGNNQLAQGTVTISDATPFEGLVTPYVGQVLTATLSGLTDGNGVTLDANGRPTGLYFVWQTTEVGGNSGWSDITTGDSYTVRSVDPGHILRAVAKFKDAEGHPESIISVPTDNPTAVYSVNENSASGTVVTNRIPFSPDYDPESINGAPPLDVDIATLYHEIDPAFSSGGRFTVVSNGLDFAGYPQYAIVVDQGGPVMLNYEAPVHTPANQSYQFADNQYQIVVNTYSDTIANGGVLVARRQFTVILNDQGDVASIAPTLDLNAPLTTTTNGQYRDEFNTSALNNSNGTTAWAATPWVEAADGANNAGTGQIQIDVGGTNQLRFLNGDGATITRTVNLAGVTTATLSFTVDQNGLDAGETVTVLFAADGVNFTQTVQTIATGSSSTGATTTVALTGPFTANSAIRFVATGITGAGEDVRIDNVNIATTTTTTTPGTPGNNHSATFTEGTGSANGTPVAIALNPAVADGNGPPIMGATVKLTNAQALDALTIQGTLPAGITSSPVDSSVPGVLTLYLAGPASFAAMQTAIGQVRFSNTSQNPDTTARVINVTVNDGEVESTIATATVTVAATNDAPDAVNDTIITNAANSVAFVIPEWALLANDTDVDSLTLDVTTVGGPTNLTGLTLNVGSVTMARTANGNASFTYTASDGAATDVATASVAQSVATTTLSETFGGTSYTTDDGAWTQDWVESNDDGSSTAAAGQIAITGNELVFDAGNGAFITRGVNLTGAISATLSFDYDENNFDAGETVLVQFAADGVNFTTIQTINNTSNEGSSSIALSGAFGANSAIRFVVSGVNAADENVQIDNINIAYTTPSANIVAGAGNQILIGDVNGSTFDAGAGDDIVLAGDGNDTILSSLGDDTVDGGAGDDTIHWTAPATGTLHGRDVVNGGTEGAAGDTFIITGNSTAETFRIYTAAAWLALDPLNVLKIPTSEIVITRTNTSSGTVVVAELDEIEEISVNTLNTTANNGNNPTTPDGGTSGGDTIQVIGDFTTTSLNYSTITIEGGTGNDTVDISALNSSHRIVFRSNGGTDTIIGTLRPQDVIELAPGQALGGMNTTANANGTTTLSNGTNSITFAAASTPPAIVEFGQVGSVIPDAGVDTPANPLVLLGTAADDMLLGNILDGGSGGDLLVVTGTGGGVASGDADNDVVIGSAGIDLLQGDAGDDTIVARAGDDTVFGGSGADTIMGDEGNDLIFGGRDADLVLAGAGNDVVFAQANDGDDVYDGGTGTDTIDLSATNLGVTVDLGAGGIGQSLSSEAGTDTIRHFENVIGGAGHDTIVASNAINVMTGGVGNDSFVFKSMAAARGDQITDFQAGDKIDLSGIVQTVLGGQGFTLGDGPTFTGAGQIIFRPEQREDGVHTLVEGSVDGQSAAFQIDLVGPHTLHKSDFVGVV